MAKELTCFISGPHERDLSLLYRVLLEKGVRVTDLYDFTIGDSLQDILKDKMLSADFCIFAIPENTNVNVIYEMGVAEGLGKPYYILVENDFKVPFYMHNYFFGPLAFHDRDLLTQAIDSIIDLFKKNLTGRLKESDKDYNELPLRDNIIIIKNLSEIQDKLKKERDRIQGSELEVIIAGFFDAIGLTFVRNDFKSEKGADFIIWNKRLGRMIGDRIVVEIKSGLLNVGELEKADRQLKEYIQKANAHIGLLLYLDRKGRRFKTQQSLYPLVFSYDIEDFITDVKQNSFDDVLLAQRNKIAHPRFTDG